MVQLVQQGECHVQRAGVVVSNRWRHSETADPFGPDSHWPTLTFINHPTGIFPVMVIWLSHSVPTRQRLLRQSTTWNALKHLRFGRVNFPGFDCLMKSEIAWRPVEQASYW